MKLKIINGRILDPYNDIDAIGSIEIADGVITEVCTDMSIGASCSDDVDVIDAAGCWVMPGLIDLHVHCREPGFEHKEIIRTAAEAAVAGGFTTICAMPNTRPVTDNPETVTLVRQKASEAGMADVLPIGSITIGQSGERLVDMAALKDAGVCGFSEDGKSVRSARLMRDALTYARDLDLPIFAHCEDMDLVNGGVIHDGEAAQRLDVKGIPNDAEDVVIARDIVLARSTGCKLHVCHLSTRSGLEIYRALRTGKITAEICPHHFALCDEDIPSDPEQAGNFKMNPPLRSRADMEYLRSHVADFDAIATDHAPHHTDEKNCGLERAAFGISGLETAVPLCVTHLINEGHLTPLEWVRRMTLNPAQILGADLMKKGTLSIGATADITIVDPNKVAEITVESLKTMGKNTPFADGFSDRLTGTVQYTIIDGNVVYKE